MLSRSRFKYSDITPFAECPSCGQMIELESFTAAVLADGRKCPFCFTFIEKKEIISSCEKYLKKTNGLRSAVQILGGYTSLLLVFPLMLLELGITYFFDLGKYNLLFFLTLLVSVSCTLGGFLGTRYWLTQFGTFQTNDEEFIVTKINVRREKITWVWINIVNLIWWIAYLKFF
jgi:hypothetical protein